MIAYLQGTILHKDQSSCIVRASDIGYRVWCSQGTLLKKDVGDYAEFFIFHAVREHAEDLYGFETYQELDLFEHLTSVSGIGPKTALTVLQCASFHDVASAIARGDANILKTIQGIGVKTAERIVVELKSKAPIFALWVSSAQHDACSASDSELIDALIGLGYSSVEARSTARNVPQGSEHNIESRLKIALQELGKRR
jgi:Holliday junction DNA helicase RuvA